MVKPIFKPFLLLLLVLLMCAAMTVGISAEESKEAEISDGGFYLMQFGSVTGYMSEGESGIVFLTESTAESLVEINISRGGKYTLRFVSKRSSGYLCKDAEGALILAGEDDGTVLFDITYDGSGYSLSTEADGERHYLTVKDGGVTFDGTASKWSISEYKPKSMYMSQVSIETKPYLAYDDLKVVVSPSYLAEYIEWDSSNRQVLIVDDTGKFCSLAEGQSNVTASLGNYTVSCKVNVGYDNDYAWFSQNNVETGGWNGKPLYNIYFRGGGYRKRFGFNGSTVNNDWLSEGCAICSIAQVLNNMGARLTNGYDIRSGLEGNLMADPYTVALANTDNYGAKSFSETLWGDPVFARHKAIAAAFNKDGAQVSVEVKYNITKKKIKEALDESPWGVVVRFDNAAHGSHYVTFNKCINPDAANWRDYKFLVSDPVSMTGADADNVLFEDSYSYKRLYYRYSHITIMQVWDYEK